MERPRPRWSSRSSSIRRCIVCSGDLVLFAVEGGEHARVVVERGDRGAQPAAEWFAAWRGGAGRRSRASLPARGRSSARPRPSAARAPAGGRGRARATSAPAVRSARVQVVERELEPAQVLLPHRRDDVEAVCQLVGAVEDPAEAADDDVGHPLPLERLQERVRIEVDRRPSAAALPQHRLQALLWRPPSADAQAAVVLADQARRGRASSSTSKPQARSSSRRVSKLGCTTSRSQRAICARSLPLRCESSTCESPARMRACRISVPLVTRQFYPIAAAKRIADASATLPRCRAVPTRSSSNSRLDQPPQRRASSRSARSAASPRRRQARAPPSSSRHPTRSSRARTCASSASSGAPIDAVFRALPVVALPGYSRPMIRAARLPRARRDAHLSATTVCGRSARGLALWMASAWITSRADAGGAKRYRVMYRARRPRKRTPLRRLVRDEARGARAPRVGRAASSRRCASLTTVSQPTTLARDACATSPSAGSASRVDVAEGTLQTYRVALGRDPAAARGLPVDEIDARRPSRRSSRELHAAGLQEADDPQDASACSRWSSTTRGVEPNPARDRAHRAAAARGAAARRAADRRARRGGRAGSCRRATGCRCSSRRHRDADRRARGAAVGRRRRAARPLAHRDEQDRPAALGRRRRPCCSRPCSRSAPATTARLRGRVFQGVTSDRLRTALDTCLHRRRRAGVLAARPPPPPRLAAPPRRNAVGADRRARRPRRPRHDGADVHARASPTSASSTTRNCSSELGDRRELRELFTDHAHLVAVQACRPRRPAPRHEARGRSRARVGAPAPGLVATQNYAPP